MRHTKDNKQQGLGFDPVRQTIGLDRTSVVKTTGAREKGTRRVSKIPNASRGHAKEYTQAKCMYSVEGMTFMPDGRSQQDIRPQVQTVRPCKCGIAKILQTSDQCQYSTR